MPRSLRALLRVAIVALTLAIVPRTVAGWDGDRFFDGELAAQDALARTVIEAVEGQRTATAYRTGSERFDGQSTVALHQMALLGLGQVVIAHPEKRDAYLPAMRAAAERLARPETLRYAARVYGHDGFSSTGSNEGHAYLGYINLGLSMLRLVEPDTPLSQLNDRITEALARRIARAPHGLIETYPGETWPPDVAAVVGSIGLHARATHADRTELLATWTKRFEACAVHATGLLVQRVKTGGCQAADAPRGSGTAIAAYFLSFATPELSRKLYEALDRHAAMSVLGFGGMREYAPGHTGEGDTNAGPILFGVSVGATGFALGAARAHGDRRRFVELYRSTSLFGVPTGVEGRLAFATGGALGNALLLAMLTAREVPR